MTQEKVSDEMLMAYADGELDGAERERIAALAQSDPKIAARIAMFSRSRQAVQDVFARVHAEPVPDELLAAVSQKDKHRARKPANDRFARFLVPVAATLVLAAGVGGYLAGLSGTTHPQGTSFLAAATSNDLLTALAATESGQRVAIETGGYSFEAMASGTYSVEDGLCRLYEASGAISGLRGVACTDGTDWNVPVAVMTGEGEYRLASEDGLMVLNTYLDELGAGPDIGAEAEANLIALQWARED